MHCDFILLYEAFEMSQLRHRGKNLHSKMNLQRGYTVHDTFCFFQSEKGPIVITDEQLHSLLLQVFVNQSSVKVTYYFSQSDSILYRRLCESSPQTTLESPWKGCEECRFPVSTQINQTSKSKFKTAFLFSNKHPR